MEQYKVTRLFVGGILEGLEYTEVTAIEYTLGWVCNKPIGGSPYKIIRIEKV